MYSSPFEDPTFRVPDLTVGEVELLLRDNAETILTQPIKELTQDEKDLNLLSK